MDKLINFFTPSRPESIITTSPNRPIESILRELEPFIENKELDQQQSNYLFKLVKDVQSHGYDRKIGVSNVNFLRAFYNKMKFLIEPPSPSTTKYEESKDPMLVTPPSPAISFPSLDISPNVSTLETKTADTDVRTEKEQTEPSFDNLMKVMDLNFQNVLNLTPKELDKLRRGKRPLSSLIEPLMGWLQEKKIRTGADLARRIKRKLRLKKKGSNATPLVKKITKQEKTHVLNIVKGQKAPKRQKISKLVEKIIDS